MHHAHTTVTTHQQHTHITATHPRHTHKILHTTTTPSHMHTHMCTHTCVHTHVYTHMRTHAALTAAPQFCRRPPSRWTTHRISGWLRARKTRTFLTRGPGAGVKGHASHVTRHTSHVTHHPHTLPHLEQRALPPELVVRHAYSIVKCMCDGKSGANDAIRRAIAALESAVHANLRQRRRRCALCCREGTRSDAPVGGGGEMGGGW